jgi:TPR repeat protein
MPRGEPFDARRALLQDQSTPRESWRVVSLMTGLRECLNRDPEGIWQPRGEDRLVETMDGIVRELTARGLDGDSLVRYGLFPELIGGVLGLLVPQWIRRGDRSDPPPVAQAWRDLLGDRLPDRLPNVDSSNVEASQATIAGVIQRVAVPLGSWALSAPLADLLRLTPPESEEEAVRAVGRVDQRLFVQYRWAAERFSITRLADWTTSSLHAEYKWTQGKAPAPCREDLMEDRAIDPRELAANIAARAVDRPPADLPNEFAGVQLNLAVRMQRHAVGLLRERRFREAATLFDFALSQNPHDAEAANNLGFCLLPDDASAALKHLDHAASRGYEPRAINAHNRAICGLLLGNPRACLAIAAETWEDLEVPPPATLWRISGSELSLAERVNVMQEIASVAAQAAALIGDAETEFLWHQRARP